MNSPKARSPPSSGGWHCSTSRRRSPPRAPGTRSRRPSLPAVPRRASSTARTPPGSPPTGPLERRRQRRRGGAAARSRRPRGRRVRQGLHRLLRRRSLRHPREPQEQGSGPALAPVHRPALEVQPEWAAQDRTRHRRRHLRRSPIDRRGRRVHRRLLHLAAGAGASVRGRPAVPVPRRGGERRGAVHLECHPRRAHRPGSARRSRCGDRGGADEPRLSHADLHGWCGNARPVGCCWHRASCSWCWRGSFRSSM